MGASKGFQLGIENLDNSSRTQLYQTFFKDHMGKGIADTSIFGVAEIQTIVSTAINGNIVTLPANQARSGYILRNTTTGDYFPIKSVNADDVTLEVKNQYNIGSVGDSFTISRFVITRVNQDGSQVVTVNSSPINFIRNAVSDNVEEDTSNINNNIALPVRNIGNKPLLAVRVNAAVTAITVAGTIIGSIASNGHRIQVSSNADDLAVYVDSVLICTCLGGSPMNLDVDMSVGDVELRSLTGANIIAGSVAVNIVG